MKTIELELPLPADHVLTLQVPASVEPGDEIRVRLTSGGPEQTRPRHVDLPLDDVGPWPAGLSLRREDLYDDAGR